MRIISFALRTFAATAVAMLNHRRKLKTMELIQYSFFLQKECFVCMYFAKKKLAKQTDLAAHFTLFTIGKRFQFPEMISSILCAIEVAQSVAVISLPWE